MKFSYVAVDSKSQTKKGIIEAANLREATKLLLGSGWYIKKIAPSGLGGPKLHFFGFGRLSLVNQLLFIKHFETMLKSGISLSEILDVISEQSPSKKFRRIVGEVADRVRSGQSISDALARYPKAFSPLITNVVKAGEESGTLEKNLEFLAGELEDRLELRQNIRSASFYPAIILSATFGLGLVLVYFVMPKITKLFKTLSFKMPWETRLLIWVGDMMDKHGALIIGGIVLALILLNLLIKQKFFKPIWHWFIIKLPVIGRLMVNYNLVLMNRTLGVLLRSGLTIDKSIMIMIDTTSNMVYQKKYRKILPEIKRGKKFSDVLADFHQSRRQPLFPLMVIKMIGVGEKSGRLDESLFYLAEYYGKEVEHTSKNLTTVLEPILLLAIGLIIGFVAVSVISPIYQITGSFGR